MKKNRKNSGGARVTPSKTISRGLDNPNENRIKSAAGADFFAKRVEMEYAEKKTEYSVKVAK